LWKSHAFAEQAANSLRFTSKDLPQFGIVDDVIKEPLGGAHRDHYRMAARLKLYLVKTLRELVAESPEQLVQNRYEKFRQMGEFLESNLHGENDGD
jgi:acetyl-CoA carboxylase carboxyl transferase subunit alpha